MTKSAEKTASNQTSQASSLSIVSVVLGLVSLTGPGLILGIPAIITGAISLKRKESGQGFSITGIVTGAISTVMSILLIALIIFAVIWGINHPDSMNQPAPGDMPLFESSGV